MQTIDPASLNNLQSRVAYTRAFLNFTAEDVKTLHAVTPLLAPLVPDIVDKVYQKVFEFTITAQIFVSRKTGSAGDTSQSLNDTDHERNKNIFKGYLGKLVSLDYEDPKSWEYLDKVGFMHTGIKGSETGFKHRANKEGLRVEYVHCGLLLGYAEDLVIEAVFDHPELDHKTKLAVVRAFNKLIGLQNDLFARHFVQ